MRAEYFIELTGVSLLRFLVSLTALLPAHTRACFSQFSRAATASAPGKSKQKAYFSRCNSQKRRGIRKKKKERGPTTDVKKECPILENVCSAQLPELAVQESRTVIVRKVLRLVLEPWSVLMRRCTWFGDQNCSNIFENAEKSTQKITTFSVSSTRNTSSKSILCLRTSSRALTTLSTRRPSYWSLFEKLEVSQIQPPADFVPNNSE